MICYKIDIDKRTLVCFVNLLVYFVNLLVYFVNLLVYFVNLLVYFVNLLVYFVNLLVYFVKGMFLKLSVTCRLLLKHTQTSVFRGDANRISVLMNNHSSHICRSF
jgi:hypothetical protein